MSALPLLSELAGRGVRIRVDGRHLAVSKGKLPDSLETSIRENKPALIASLERLRRYATNDDEWQEIVSRPEQLQAMIYSLVTAEVRERGEIPSSYTAVVYCQTCNQDVPHFPVGVEMVGACVWCLNGQPVPINSRGAIKDVNAKEPKFKKRKNQ